MPKAYGDSEGGHPHPLIDLNKTEGVENFEKNFFSLPLNPCENYFLSYLFYLLFLASLKEILFMLRPLSILVCIQRCYNSLSEFGTLFNALWEVILEKEWTSTLTIQ